MALGVEGEVRAVHFAIGVVVAVFGELGRDHSGCGGNVVVELDVVDPGELANGRTISRNAHRGNLLLWAFADLCFGDNRGFEREGGARIEIREVVDLEVELDRARIQRRPRCVASNGIAGHLATNHKDVVPGCRELVNGEAIDLDLLQTPRAEAGRSPLLHHGVLGGLESFGGIVVDVLDDGEHPDAVVETVLCVVALAVVRESNVQQSVFALGKISTACFDGEVKAILEVFRLGRRRHLNLVVIHLDHRVPTLSAVLAHRLALRLAL
mmetsp:Transcript_30746/g.70900  ORF Transcript_30746/g.70900 Transcript_30746/m.70900 type:complete len:268 (-) Transcript_30746:156-959(-)